MQRESTASYLHLDAWVEEVSINVENILVFQYKRIIFIYSRAGLKMKSIGTKADRHCEEVDCGALSCKLPHLFLDSCSHSGAAERCSMQWLSWQAVNKGSQLVFPPLEASHALTPPTSAWWLSGLWHILKVALEFSLEEWSTFSLASNISKLITKAEWHVTVCIFRDM